MKLSSLSICIPAYQDQDTIEQVVREAKYIAKQVSSRFEVLVINDGSTDETGKRLRRLQRNIPELRIIHHAKNCGYGQTIKELYYHGKNDWLFTIPGDNQISAKELLKLIPASKTADIVIGWRNNRFDNLSRIRQSAIYNGLLKILFHLELHDINSVRLMKKTIMSGRKLLTTSAFVDAELTISAVRDGFRVIEVPILHKKRITTGASGGKWSIIFPVIKDMIWYFVKIL